MYKFSAPHHILGLITLFAFMSGCAWTPRVETPIFEDSQVSVFLMTVSEETFSADHPVSFQSDTMIRILKGLRLKPHKRLLQKLFTNDHSPQPALSDEQTSVLAVHLQKAFSQVTPEEHVAFQTRGNPIQDIQGIKGTMYVKNENLYITLTFPSPGAQASPKTAGRTVRLNQEGNGNPAIVFYPKEALLEDQTPHWLFGGENKNHVAINLPRLAAFRHQNSPPALQTDKTPNLVPQEPTSTSNDPSPQMEVETSADHPRPTSDTQLLLEEIKTLRQELADQKKALEELKQNKPEPR